MPFILGNFYTARMYESRNVPVIFTLDPNLISALGYLKTLPDDGKVLTLPMTLSYYQVIYGKQGGAYDGLSMVKFLDGKEDLPSLQSFGPYESVMVDSLKNENAHQVMQILSLQNIRYIFRDTDTRIIENFPKYPFYRFDMTADIPVIDSQTSYDKFLELFPLTTIYKKGLFKIQKLDTSIVRPIIYSPDVVYSSIADALNGQSFRSAYVDASSCGRVQCAIVRADTPAVNFTQADSETYKVTIDIAKNTDPFLLILSEDYDPSWTLNVSGLVQSHILANGYANGWIIDPKQFHSQKIEGVVHLGFQNYYRMGLIVSEFTGGVVFLIGVALFFKKYAKKK
jgi:hypothetical protein